LAKVLKRDELRLYTLIWERFVASQMSAAVFDQTTVDIAALPLNAQHRYTFRATGSVLKFAGFTKVYQEKEEEDGKAPARARTLPDVAEGATLDLHRLEPKQHFTEPPPRYTEASLVKALEENGIGRPSTYSTIVETIQARQYVTQAERRFYPTEIGVAVNDLLAEHFPDIVDLEFTASMEDRLDRVEEGDEDWVSVLKKFYGPFKAELEQAERILPKAQFKDEPTDELCPNCGRPMVIKSGRFGRFISCTGYPECKTTRPLIKDTGVKCPVDGGVIAERRSRKGRVFYGCVNYPKCDFVLWDRPLPQTCPVCGALLVQKTKRGGATEVECSADRTHNVGGIAAVS